MKQQFYKKIISKVSSFFIVRQNKYKKASIFLLVCLMPMTSSIFIFDSVLEDGVGGVDGINGSYGVVVSPDGKHVYTASSTDDAVTAFSRNTSTGQLTFIETLKDNSQTGGTIDGLNAAKRLAISPDGNHIYVPSSTDDALIVFSRNSSTGNLTYVETHTDALLGVDGLNGAYEAVVSPDNNHVYVVGSSDDAVVVFSRNTSTGALTYIETHYDGIAGVDGLNGAKGIEISPDGNHIYTAASVDDAVAVFSRNASTGQLTYVERLRDGISGVDGLNGAHGVFVSPDNAHVYTVASSDDAVTVFSRNVSTGELTYIETLKDDSQTGGTVPYLNAGRSIIGTSDGSYIITTSSSDHAITIFARDAITGQLTVTDSHIDGINGVNGLNLAQSTAVSPDGNSIYTVSTGDDAIATFNANSISLPIDLLNFDGQRNNEKQVLLTWTTTSEKNNAGFEIEMSTDGQNFEQIGFVDGAGNSTEVMSYEFLVNNSQSAYYRLKQIDFDGSFEYSEMRFVEGIETNLAVNIYPNPSQGEIQIDIPNYKDEIKIRVSNTQGKEILNVKGTEEVLNKKLNHIFPHLENGLYIFKVQVLDKGWTERIILRR